MTLRALALLSAALFTGGALYVSLVEHPVRMRLEPWAAVAEFRLSYRRAAPWQAATAILAAVCGVLASMAGDSWTWSIGGLLVGAAVPFTLVAILPTNDRLFREGMADDIERRTVLARWGRLHWVRSAFGTVGLLLLIGAALHRA